MADYKYEKDAMLHLLDRNVLIFQTVDSATYFTGRCVGVTHDHLVLDSVIWHRSTGRHSEFVAGGDSSEREAYPSDGEVLFPRSRNLLAMTWSGDVNGGTK